jgi:hypothetical protein
MTRARWIVLGVLLAALTATQHFGLERQPETKTENALRNLPDVGAPQMLSTYVGSLFFGAFRAVAIDILWIQLKRAEEERRWYERREIVKMISYVQPRNPEVRAHLGWHSAYNVANGFKDPEKAWSWVRFGLLWLRDGIRIMPDNAHLKLELARTLLHKPSWRAPELDVALLKRIESDVDLQRQLRPDGHPADGAPLSAFQLARLWMERAKKDIKSEDDSKPHKTQMGLFIYPSSLDGFRRQAIYFEAIRRWQGGDLEGALAGVREAEAHVRTMLRHDYGVPLSSWFKDCAAFYADLPAALAALSRAETTRARADELEALKLTQELLTRFDSYPDESFLWESGNPKAPLNALKRRVAGAADENEFNDGWGFATDLRPGELFAADLSPAGLDADWYWVNVQPPRPERGEGPPPAVPPNPIRFRISFNRPAASGAELKVTVLNPRREELKTAEIRGKGELEILASEWGPWALKVEPRDPAAPPPADTRYYIQASRAD